jgi:hypothetical protein
MDVENLAKELILKNMTPEQQMAVLDSVRQSVANAKEVQKKKISENVDLVVQALKKIEADIRSRFDDVGNAIEKRVASIQDGRDGINGKDGRDGKDGKSGRDGAKGDKGDAGRDGIDGVDGVDGISVTSARIDFDGSLVITLSSGVELNVGEVVAPDLAERIKVITNGGGTSQSVLDALASLQTQITNLIPSQTGNSGKYLTTNGTALSWASVAGGLSYQGTWNAFTNTPTLTSSVGVNGYYYITATAGSTNLNGITDWQIGDWLLFNGSVWQKIDQSEILQTITSTNGSISVTTIGSNVNLANNGVTSAVAGTGISVSGATGAVTITNSAPDQTVALTQGGTTTITGTYPNFTISSADQFQGTVTSVTGTSPVASSGGATPAISLETSYGDTQNPYASKTAKFVLAAPNASSGVPTFRAIVDTDIPTLNQNTTGSAATLTTPRAIYGNNFDGSAALTQIIASTYGGTGNGFTKFTGATTAERTYTLPDATTTILTTNAAVTVGQGGTGQTSYTDGQLLIGNTTGNTLTKTTLTAGTGIAITNGSGSISIASTATGTVTSVAATVPAFLSITGSPVTTTGTLAIGLSGTALPIANGGTAATSASAARTSLGLVIGTDVLAPSGSGASLTSLNASNISSGTLAAARLPAGSILQVKNYQFATIFTTSTQIPLDNTIPQITEGGQFLTLAITPTSATSKLFIQINYFYAVNAAAHVTTAIFQDSTANAIAAQCTYLSVGGENQQAAINYYMTSGTTSATTFTARIGANNSNTVYVNGSNSGTVFYGGVGISSMTIMEIAV